MTEKETSRHGTGERKRKKKQRERATHAIDGRRRRLLFRLLLFFFFFFFFTPYHHDLVLLSREHPVPQAREDDSHLAKTGCVGVERERKREREKNNDQSTRKKSNSGLDAEEAKTKNGGEHRTKKKKPKKSKGNDIGLLHLLLSPPILTSLEREQSRCDLCCRLSSPSLAQSTREPGRWRTVERKHRCRLRRRRVGPPTSNHGDRASSGSSRSCSLALPAGPRSSWAPRACSRLTTTTMRNMLLRRLRRPLLLPNLLLRRRGARFWSPRCCSPRSPQRPPPPPCCHLAPQKPLQQQTKQATNSTPLQRASPCSRQGDGSSSQSRAPTFCSRPLGTRGQR